MKQQYYMYCMMVMLVMMFISVESQVDQDRSCINKLAPCLNYLNGTRDPPDSCCEPLKSVIKSIPECLCSLISNKGTKQAQEAGIDVSEAQQLPGKCGQHVNPIACLTDSGGSSNSDNNSAFRKESMVLVVAILSIIIHLLCMLPDIHL